jgi:hypothetical protein
VADKEDLELVALTPEAVELESFNPESSLPYGLTTDHIRAPMHDFVEFLGFINQQMYTRDIERLEAMLMPANFSSIVGEFMNTSIPKHCPTLVKNQYHNGHPDLLPAGMFSDNAAQHAGEGIEVTGSRNLHGWQSHNPEDTWLMVFVFDSNRPVDAAKGIDPKPFRFVRVAGARLKEADWTFSGRTGTSRRTITASVNPTGYDKMMANLAAMSGRHGGTWTGRDGGRVDLCGTNREQQRSENIR